eukprot:s6250_g3.t1
MAGPVTTAPRRGCTEAFYRRSRSSKAKTENKTKKNCTDQQPPTCLRKPHLLAQGQAGETETLTADSFQDKDWKSRPGGICDYQEQAHLHLRQHLQVKACVSLYFQDTDLSFFGCSRQRTPAD